MTDITNNRDQILELAAKHGASHVRVFGSVARRQSDNASDIDLLVRMAPDRSLVDRIALVNDLEALLQTSVDVVNERALHPAIREQVLAEAVKL